MGGWGGSLILSLYRFMSKFGPPCAAPSVDSAGKYCYNTTAILTCNDTAIMSTRQAADQVSQKGSGRWLLPARLLPGRRPRLLPGGRPRPARASKPPSAARSRASAMRAMRVRCTCIAQWAERCECCVKYMQRCTRSRPGGWGPLGGGPMPPQERLPLRLVSPRTVPAQSPHSPRWKFTQSPLFIDL